MAKNSEKTIAFSQTGDSGALYRAKISCFPALFALPKRQSFGLLNPCRRSPHPRDGRSPPLAATDGSGPILRVSASKRFKPNLHQFAPNGK
jgi:hypothetical protein